MRPIRYTAPLVQSYLRVTPISETCVGIAEQKIPARAPLYGFDYVPERARQRQYVVALILAASAGDRPRKISIRSRPALKPPRKLEQLVSSRWKMHCW